MSIDPAIRVLNRSIPRDNGCMEFQGHIGKNGYGYVMFRDHTPRLVHRTVYEFIKGPIPKGLQLDHLCRNRICVNPDHLEPVTHRVNSLRGRGAPALNAKKTHCPKGHEYTPENTYLQKRPPNDVGRICRTCMSAYQKRRYAASKA